MPDLTPRQAQVANMIAEGMPAKSIANDLGISVGSVKIHTGNAFRKLGVRNRTQLAIEWIRRKRSGQS